MAYKEVLRRERNFCSGKCRVRHHRSALRKPSSLGRKHPEPIDVSST